ncbi:MAG: SH3 domain-containing protein [Flavobacteriales bacterium]
MKKIIFLFLIIVLPSFIFTQEVLFSHSGMSGNKVKSQTNIDYLFELIKNKDNTEIKVFYKNRFIDKQKIENKDTLQLSYLKSLGTTFKSEGQDVFLFYFGDYRDSKIEFYSWNNKRFIPYTHPFPDSSFYAYRRGSQLIVEPLVNFRLNPSLDSEKIKVLSLGTEVSVLQHRFKRDTLGQDYGYWSKISVAGDTGYLWEDFISLHYFDSYKEKSLRFVIRDGKDYKHQLMAIRENKVLDTYSFQRISNLRGAHSMGSMGLKDVEEIIGVCYSGGSCGVPSGDVQIAWDGNVFRKFINEEGTGDGGLSFGQSILLPANIGGVENTIRVTTYDSESIDIFSKIGTEDSYANIDRLSLTRDYRYDNWKLKEQFSETQLMEKLLVSKFPRHKLQYFEKGDLNQDGIKDAIIYAVDTVGQWTGEYGAKKNKSLIVIVLKGKEGGYNIKASSKKIIKHEENSPLTKIEITPVGFDLKIFYSGYYNDENNPRQYSMTYKYDKEVDNFRLTKTSEYFPPHRESGERKLEVYNYIKKYIYFTDSYHPSW